jgi:hypothetical protein
VQALLKAKMKLAAGGGGMLKGMLGKMRAGKPPPVEPPKKMTGAQRLVARLGTNKAIVASKRGDASTSGLMLLAGTLKRVQGSAPPPPARANPLRLMKRVALAGKLAAGATQDATLQGGGDHEQALRCRDCIRQPKLWPSQMSKAGKRVGKLAAAGGKAVGRCCKAVGAGLAAAACGCWQKLRHPSLLCKSCKKCGDYLKFVVAGIGAWFAALRAVKGCGRACARLRRFCAPLCDRLSAWCRRAREEHCIPVKRAETKGTEQSRPHFLDFWQATEEERDAHRARTKPPKVAQPEPLAEAEAGAGAEGEGEGGAAEPEPEVPAEQIGGMLAALTSLRAAPQEPETEPAEAAPLEEL